MAVREVEIEVPQTPEQANPNPVPQVQPSEEESMFEVYGPGDELPAETPEKSEAELQVEALQAQLAQQREESTTLQSGFGALAETLKELKSTPAPAPAAPAPPCACWAL